MSQELLDRAQIAATLQQVGSKRVSERVGAGLGSNGGPDKAPSYDSADRSIGQGFVSDADKQWILTRSDWTNR